MSESHAMQETSDSSYLVNGSSYLESLYESYLLDPDSVSTELKEFFANFGSQQDIPHAPVREEILELGKHTERFLYNGSHTQTLNENDIISRYKKQAAVQSLIHAYRMHGHLYAKLDPLQLNIPELPSSLSLEQHGLSKADLNEVFETHISNFPKGTLKQIIEKLETWYCHTVGVEYMHISNPEEVRWLQERMECNEKTHALNANEKKQLLQRLTATEGLEKYLGSKFVGQKRFSLEGGDSLIPMLDKIILEYAEKKAEEIVIGMAHRGRLNVLVNILGKAPEDLFKQFQGSLLDTSRSGDVKYHQGFSSDWKIESGYIHLALAFNPSHLEIISPVVEGAVRGKQEIAADKANLSHGFHKVIPVAIHGDAAFTGQGVVMETFNLSQTRGYTTGGTIHIVINNQVGFTTSEPSDARSTLYCTDISKMVEAPVWHVNGNDIEACVFVSKLAVDYREKFGKDMVIDLVCYRRHGHNEADEPSATQPLMYQAIRALPTGRQLYANQLVAENVLSSEEVESYVDDYRKALDAGHPLVPYLAETDYIHSLSMDWSLYFKHKWNEPTDTKVDAKTLKNLAKKLEILPEKFALQPQVQKVMQDRSKMTETGQDLNWGYAETLAYATLIEEGYAVRISGQDSGRGTFAHRHAVLHDQNSDQIYIPLQNVSPKKSAIVIIDSVLSEEAVLAFEYGYASSNPEKLVIWEAQFGDFANGAQVVIDQFISSGEQKWGRLCGLVLFLPHGYEGQGPEHSSARLERYLQLCAQHNLQVCVPTTPAQIYHLLRLQMIRPYHRPLIVMTPKSLLRHKLAVSTFEDLSEGHFSAVIPETEPLNASNIQRIILCSGKVYYDLFQYRKEKNITDTAILRIEQLYPFPKDFLKQALSAYSTAKKVIWCQEEPKNQGAWYCSSHHFRACLLPKQTLSYAGRDSSASPAAGSMVAHNKEQEALIKQAFES